MPHPQLRGNEPPGTIHIPKVGTTPTNQIYDFISAGSAHYSLVQLKGRPEPTLVSEGLAYFQKRLPEFVRISRSRLINPQLL